ncbi:MAG: extracellular solute-binding protein [Blastochloris sp.]|nr:extracellular solute-binding protein [Blastochloris sp.]
MQRHAQRAVYILIALIIFSACAPGQTTPTATPGAENAPTGIAAGTTQAEGVVTIGFAAQSWERQTYEPLVETFNAENPTIRVQLVSADDALQAEQGQLSSPSDMTRRIVSIADTATAFFLTQEDIDNGYLYNLVPLMDGDANFDRDDFYPGALSAVSTSDGVYALPRVVNVPLLSYNKDLWTARGVSAPDPNWTWNDLMASAEQIAQKQGDQVDVYGFLDGGSGVFALLSELSAAGIDLLAAPTQETRLDTPEIQQALERIAALQDSGAIYSAPASESGVPNVQPDEFQKLISDQRVGIWISGFLPTDPDQQAQLPAVGTLPFPAVDVPFLSGGVQSYIMSSGTQHPQEAWRWLEFLSRQPLDEQVGGMSGPGTVPSRKSVAESSGFWNELDEETTAAIQTMLERPSKPMSSSLMGSQVSALPLLGQALNDITYADKDVDVALREAQATLEEQVAQAAQTPQPTAAAAGPIVVATPVSQVAAEGATTITFNAAGFDAGAIRRIAQSFNQNNPEIFVQVTEPDFSQETASTFAGIAAQSDCFTWFAQPTQQELTATLNLQPLIDVDSTFKLDEYPPALLTTYQRDGGLHGIPYALNLRTLTYNKTMFDAAGLEYPTAAWTTDDFLNAAQQLTTGDGAEKQYGYVSIGQQTNDLMFFLSQFGAQVFTGEEGALQPNFTDAKVIQATQYVLDLWKNTSPHKQLQGYSQDSAMDMESFQLLSDGRIAMWLGFDSFGGFGFGGNQGDLATAPAPLGSGGLSADDIQSRGLYISATTQHADACWTWLQQLSGDASLCRAVSRRASRSLSRRRSLHKRSQARSTSTMPIVRSWTAARSLRQV